MALFSERYGYTKPSDVIIREQIPVAIQNAICSCYDDLRNSYSFKYSKSPFDSTTYYIEMDRFLWTYYLNRRKRDFGEDGYYQIVATEYIASDKFSWYEKLNLIEKSIKYLNTLFKENDVRRKEVENFIISLNTEFERFNFAYRIIGDEIVEISSKEEISSIEEAMTGSENIKIHLDNALKLYSQRPNPDPSNSIKESISAVEAFCRDITNEESLGKALNKLENNGVNFPKLLKTAWDKLYAYTNQKDTGIRHALMDADSTYVPSVDEALYMLVSCSAFINYLRKKL